MNKDNVIEKNEKYIETCVLHANKKNNYICGDFSMCKRTLAHTTFILCDGLGSGIKAHIASTMCASRIYKSVELDVSINTICDNITYSMNMAKAKDLPYSAFTIIRVLNNGQYTVISYEMPLPVIIENNYATKISPRYFSMNGEILAETKGILSDNHGIMVFSDGVSQAGLGTKYPLGLSTEGVANYTNRILKEISLNKTDIFINKVLKKVYSISGKRFEDDTSVAVLRCRPSKILNILSGPPISKNIDKRVVEKFINSQGKKVICGSSTADMVSRETKKELKVEKMPTFLAEPPTYSIEGIDIVTEGTMTLNQLYNLMEDTELKDYDGDNSTICVVNIYKMILKADVIKFMIGKSENISHEDISFKQLGIISRKKIINLIEKKLNELGKLVLIEFN
jgi:hypothetical protein